MKTHNKLFDFGLGLALATLALAGLALLHLSAEEAPAVSAVAPELHVKDAMVNTATAGQNAAIMAVIMNNNAAAVTVTQASTPAARSVRFQRYSKQAGSPLLQIHPLDKLEFPAGYTTVLTPGALEVELVGLTQDLVADNEIPLMLTFDNGSTRTLRVHVTGSAE